MNPKTLWIFFGKGFKRPRRRSLEAQTPAPIPRPPSMGFSPWGPTERSARGQHWKRCCFFHVFVSFVFCFLVYRCFFFFFSVFHVFSSFFAADPSVQKMSEKVFMLYIYPGKSTPKYTFRITINATMKSRDLSYFCPMTMTVRISYF